jgi:hypothetical protein
MGLLGQEAESPVEYSPGSLVISGLLLAYPIRCGLIRAFTGWHLSTRRASANVSAA